MLRAMRADALLLLAAALVMGCACVEPSSSRRGNLRSMPRATVGTVLASGPGDELPGGTRSSPLFSHNDAEIARHALLAAVDEVKRSTGHTASALSKLANRPPSLGNRGLSGVNGPFTRYLDYGSRQLPWLHGSLRGVSTLASVASHVDDPDMHLALLRMTGPRLEAAILGDLLLAAWLDYLHLADAVLRQCPAYSVETLFIDMHRVQQLIEPTLAALASGEPTRIEAAALAAPGLMGQLTGVARRVEPDDHAHARRRRSQDRADIDAERDPEGRRKGNEAL